MESIFRHSKIHSWNSYQYNQKPYLVYFSVNLCSHYFCGFQSMTDKIRNVYLLVALKFCLLSVVCVCWAYTFLCRGLNKGEIQYITRAILMCSDIFRTILQAGNTAHVWKISQKWMAFVFGNLYIHQTFPNCISN